MNTAPRKPINLDTPKPMITVTGAPAQRGAIRLVVFFYLWEMFQTCTGSNVFFKCYETLSGYIFKAPLPMGNTSTGRREWEAGY